MVTHYTGKLYSYYIEKAVMWCVVQMISIISTLNQTYKTSPKCVLEVHLPSSSSYYNKIYIILFYLSNQFNPPVSQSPSLTLLQTPAEIKYKLLLLLQKPIFTLPSYILFIFLFKKTRKKQKLNYKNIIKKSSEIYERWGCGNNFLELNSKQIKS